MFERYPGLTAQQMKEHLYVEIQSALYNRYGPDPDAKVRKRAEEEWAAIKRTGLVTTVAFLHVPIHLKTTLTIQEANAYTGIGLNRLNNLLRSPNCPFVLFVGSRKLVKRKEFEQFISNKLVI